MKKVIRLTESDLTRIVNRVIKENEDNSENIKESFDPMVGIDNFLNNPIMVTLATAWLLSGKFKVSNLKSNLEEMKNDFLDYCNSMGYSIDKEILDLKFKQLINRVKGILKSSTGNEEMNEEDNHEQNSFDLYTDSQEDINYDIKAMDCEGSRFGNMSSVMVNDDDTIVIRYCKGDDEELEYLKEKGKRLLYRNYGM